MLKLFSLPAQMDHLILPFYCSTTMDARPINQRDSLSYVRITNIPSQLDREEMLNKFWKFGRIDHVQYWPNQPCFIGYANLKSAIYAMKQGKRKGSWDLNIQLIWDDPTLDPLDAAGEYP